MILLEPQEISCCYERGAQDRSFWCWGKARRAVDVRISKATGEKILIQLQAIYGVPDLGAEDVRMGEFIQELQEEVG